MNQRSMRARALPVLAIGMALFAFGCVKTAAKETSATQVTTPQSDASPSVERVREAAAISAAIEKDPQRATEILKDHGLTPDSFQDLLFKIAQDPQLTDAYEAARKDGSS